MISHLSFRIDIEVGQDLTLSLVLFTLYIASIFHIFEKEPKIYSYFDPFFYK